MKRIKDMFKKRQRAGQAALIPFVTCGDPDLETTVELVLVMEESGADLVELGLPFSDPLADGPTIQAASQRALENGMNTDRFLEAVEAIRRRSRIPLVLMGYYNNILQYGLERFAKAASQVGIDGTIIPDLPLEEATEWRRVASAHGIANILLTAPTTPPERASRIARASRGFLYHVSVTGITGARTELPKEVTGSIAALKETSPVPVCVGFGVATPEQVSMLSQVADGVIVGSALVKRIEAGIGSGKKAIVSEVAKFVSALKEGVSRA